MSNGPWVDRTRSGMPGRHIKTDKLNEQLKHSSATRFPFLSVTSSETDTLLQPPPCVDTTSSRFFVVLLNFDMRYNYDSLPTGKDTSRECQRSWGWRRQLCANHIVDTLLFVGITQDPGVVHHDNVRQKHKSAKEELFHVWM